MIAFNEESVREEVRAWLETNWDPNLSLVAWRNLLVDSGWGVPDWPQAWYGHDLPLALVPVVEEEFERLGAIGVSRKGTSSLAAATILAHGSDAQREKFLRRILTGEDAWCQLFSEPGSGSDLAGATTRAVRQGDHYVINGQKVWNTSAHHADYGILLARTNFDVPKHRGLSYFLLPMRQPGVEVRPLRQMNGHASFNEVFFADAIVPREFMLEQEGDGWKIATTTLMHERRYSDSTRREKQATERPERIYREEAEEIAIALEPYTWYPQRAGRVDLVIERAKATGRNTDPVVRQEIAKLLGMARCAEWTARRARVAQEQGRQPGPEGSLGKLASSYVARAANRVHTMITGTDAMLTGDDSPMHGVIAEILVSTPAISIAGGTDEIQKNIISERVLQMPKEMRIDTHVPFRDVLKNAVPKS
jgi:alkylation response protein AidB-like acyl-CoA dehydrogenase